MATAPSRTTKTFEPVASHSSSRVLAKIASLAPRSWAYASARTFSAYEWSSGPRSRRGRCAPTAPRRRATESGHGRNGLLAATITVGPALPRSEPSGATPPVTVMRNRASSWPLAASTAHAAARSASRSGTGEPESRCRVREPVEVAASTRTARRRRRGWSRTRRRRRAARGRTGRCGRRRRPAPSSHTPVELGGAGSAASAREAVTRRLDRYLARRRRRPPPPGAGPL